jgi:hypothetical protein
MLRVRATFRIPKLQIVKYLLHWATSGRPSAVAIAVAKPKEHPV